MHGIEGQVEEEGLVLGLFGDDPFGLGGKQIGAIALFLQGLLVSMPVVNGEAGRGDGDSSPT